MSGTHDELFVKMQLGVVYRAADGTITQVNPAAERMLGVTLAQMQGKVPLDPRWKTIHEDGSDFPPDDYPSRVSLRTGEEVHNVVMGVFNPQIQAYTWTNINAVPLFLPGAEVPHGSFSTFEDITNLRLAGIVEATDVAIFGTTIDGTILNWSSGGESIYGYRAEEVIGQSIALLATPKKHLELTEILGRVAKKKRVARLETLHRHKDGSPIEVALRAAPVEDASGHIVGAAFMARDISDAKRVERALRDSEKRYRSLFENASFGIFHSLPEGRFLRVNPALARLAGYTSPEEMVSSITDIGTQVYADPQRRLGKLGAIMKNDGWYHDENLYRRKDGSLLTVKVMLRKVFSPDGTLAYLEGFIEDITERKQMEEQLAHLSNHDPLTGLPNRRYLEEAATRVMARANRGRPSALLFLDVDRFKSINDTLGHEAGDRALQMLVRLLQANLRPEDLLVRIGGDEFAVLLEGADSRIALEIANRLCQAVTEHSLVVDCCSFELSLSVGAALIDGGEELGQVLSHADMAMYRAKAKKGNQVALYEIRRR